MPVTVFVADTNAQAQTKINTEGTGGTVNYEVGVHLRRRVTPQAGQTHQGAPGGTTVFDGSVEIADWTVEGSMWWAPVPGGVTDKQTGTNSQYGDTAAQLAEELFRDGVRFRRVNTKAEVPAASSPSETFRAGKWWLDYSNNRVYVGVDPAGFSFRMSHTQYAITPLADPLAGSVTCRRLTVRMYATGMRRGPLGGGMGFQGVTANVGWVWEQCTVENCHGSGFVGTVGGTLRWCTSYRNGHTGGLMRGASAEADTGDGMRGSGLLGDVLVEDSVFTENGQNRHAYLWEGGGLKITRTTDPKTCVVHNNHFTRNRVSGLWFDVWCENITATSNLVDFNERTGIITELSRGPAEIRDNTVEFNGGVGAQVNVETGQVITDNPRPGIWIGKSRFQEVWRNVLRGNGQHGIMMQSRDTDYLPYLNDNDIHHNHFDETPDAFQSWSGILNDGVSDNSRLLLCTANHNQYWNTAARWNPYRWGHTSQTNWEDAFKTFAEWQAIPLDVDGAERTDAFVVPAGFAPYAEPDPPPDPPPEETPTNQETLAVASVGATAWTPLGAATLVDALNGAGDAMSPRSPSNAVLPVTFAGPQGGSVSQVVEFRFDDFYRSGDSGLAAVFELGYDWDGSFVVLETVNESNLSASPTDLYYAPTVQPPPGVTLRARIIANADFAPLLPSSSTYPGSDTYPSG